MDDGEMVCRARRWRAAVSEEGILRLRDNLLLRPLPRPGVWFCSGATVYVADFTLPPHPGYIRGAGDC